MYYKKIQTDYCTIEFHNNWLGKETVMVNGQIVSEKSSVMGTDHHFFVTENGHQVRYILTTKVNNNLQVFLDLRRNGILIEKDIPIPYGSKQKTPNNPYKKQGILKLKDYAIKDAISDLKKALEINREDPDIYFYLACGYSIEEKAADGFECLKKAVEYNLQDTEIILNHEMLAYLRMQEGFDDFLHSNFTKYDKSKLSDGEIK